MLSWRWCWLALNVIYDICIFCNDLCVVLHWLRWIRHPFLTADTAVFYGVCTSTLASKQRSTTKFQDVAGFLLPPFTILHGQVSTSSSGGAEAKAEAFFVPLIELPPPPSATIRYHPLPSATIRYHPLPSATIRYHPLPTTATATTTAAPAASAAPNTDSAAATTATANTATSTTATFFASTSTSTSSSTCFFLTFLRDRNLKRGDLANGGWEGKDPNISMHFAHLNECQRSQYCTVPIVHLYHTKFRLVFIK